MTRIVNLAFWMFLRLASAAQVRVIICLWIYEQSDFREILVIYGDYLTSSSDYCLTAVCKSGE